MFALAVPLMAQLPLSLPQAVHQALDSHPGLKAAEAGTAKAMTGIREARSGRYPRVRFSESLQRSNNPVFAFGSLLNQRQFAEANFAIDSLNHPSAVSNFQSQLQVEQVLFDFGRTGRTIDAAELRQEMAGVREQSNLSDVILHVVQTYFGVALAEERLRVAVQSLGSAQADERRAQAMFEAGVTTRADVLSVQVHQAAMEEQRIDALHSVEIARAALNDALGVSLDQHYQLTTPLTEVRLADIPVESYEQTARERHPGLRQVELGRELARAELLRSKTELWPQLVATGVVEADRQRFGSRGGGNWLAGVSLRWDVFNGSRTQARIASARYAETEAAALERQADSAVRLGVRQSFSRLRAATERVGVAAAAVTQAEESLRIIQNRYEAGLTTVTELIRSETAHLTARARHLAALYDQRVAAAALDHAAGRLTADSEALQ